MYKMLLPLLILANLAGVARAESISLLTEDYPPFSYRQDNEIKGAIVDQARRIMTGLGTYTITLMPWARAYSEAQTTTMTCALGTAHTPERDSLFKWVEPLMIDRNILVKHKGSDVSATTLDEAKRYTVGTWREDYTETLLRQFNFPKIDVASDSSATMRKLMNDRIDLMPMSEIYYLKLVKDGQPVERVTELSQKSIGIACQRDFPEPLREKMQAALNDMIADGTQKRIFQQYDMPLEN